jgi:hypothetical protein
MLTLFGLAIGVAIYALVTGIGTAANIPPPYGPIIVAALIVLLTLVILFVVPIALRGEIERRIRARLEDADFKESLDGTGLLSYAGEGLAEALARKAIQTINASSTPLSWDVDASGTPGRNRFQKQFWQTFFVTDGKCHFSVRR